MNKQPKMITQTRWEYFCLLCVYYYFKYNDNNSAESSSWGQTLKTHRGKPLNSPFNWDTFYHVLPSHNVFVFVCMPNLNLTQTNHLSVELTLLSHLNIFLACTIFPPGRLNGSGITVEFAISCLLQQEELRTEYNAARLKESIQFIRYQFESVDELCAESRLFLT